MPAERFYYEGPVDPHKPLIISGKEFHHLVNVMRCRQGDSLEFVDGCGGLGRAKVGTLGKREVLLEIEAFHVALPATFRLILAQAIPRQNRLDTIVEKGCELGMTELWLFPSEYSERKELAAGQLDRLQQVAVAAMKQCGRLFLPTLIMQPRPSEWLHLPKYCFFGDVSPDAPPLQSVLHQLSKPDSILFCVGPESGFSSQEEALLREKGLQGVKLHDNILRTDTAAIVGLALLAHQQLAFKES